MLRIIPQWQLIEHTFLTIIAVSHLMSLNVYITDTIIRVQMDAQSRWFKKTALQEMNLTQQMKPRMYGALEINQTYKSTELTKSNNARKPASRKRGCYSVKQPVSTTLCYKNILKQLKSLKNRQQKSPGRHKSKLAISKSKKKKGYNLYDYPVLNMNPHSETHLSNKLNKTLRKIKEVDYFKDEDSLIPLASTSETSNYEPKHYEAIATINDEEIDFKDMHSFQQNKNTCHPNQYHCTFFDLMARRIQTAWRQYLTKKLVAQYTTLLIDQRGQTSRLRSSRLKKQPKEQEQAHDFLQISQRIGIAKKKETQKIQIHQSSAEQGNSFFQEIRIQDHSMGRQSEQKRNKETEHYENLIKQIQLEQLQKWDQIINLISLTKSQNPSQIEGLLKELVDKSQNNKRHLQKHSREISNPSSQNSQCPRIEEEKYNKSELSCLERVKGDNSSYGSAPFEEGFNSKKYIEYLDCDIYPQKSNSVHSSHSQPEKVTSRQRQCKIILDIPQDGINIARVESFKEIVRKQKTISRVNSDTKLQKIRASIELSQQINEQQLKSQTYFPLQVSFKEDTQLEDISQTKEENCQVESDQSQKVMRRSGEGRTQLQVMNIDKDISSDEDNYNEAHQKGQTISIMIFNFLLFEVLKELNRSQTILALFKQHTLNSKFKAKNGMVRIKGGFPTNHIEVENFVNNTNTYILKNLPHVFLNLEVPTGPSALQMLHYMHPNQKQDSYPQEATDQSNIMVIPSNVFEDLWNVKTESSPQSARFQPIQSYKQPNGQPPKLLDCTKSLNRVFYRLMFDAYNECLDFQRNFGQFGKPFPWKKTPMFFHFKTKKNLQDGISNAKKRIIELAKTYCGIIVEKEEMNELNGSQQYLQQVQEDRLSRMLAQDLLESEDKWVFYDDEEAEILIELALMIQQQLLAQGAREIEIKF